jgi:TetR/AcrR family transcriptional regulator
MAKTEISRKERERLQHKQEIMNIALKLFSEMGFHNVSMQQIAEKSEFSVGTLYNFFESKETLFEELINNASAKALNEFLEVLDGPGNEKERLQAFIRHQPKFLEKHGTILKLYISEMGVKTPKLYKFSDVNRISEVIDSKLSQIIRQGIEKGIFRSVDAEVAGKTIGSVIERLILETEGNCDKNAVIDKFRKVEQLFLEGLLVPQE